MQVAKNPYHPSTVKFYAGVNYSSKLFQTEDDYVIAMVRSMPSLSSKLIPAKSCADLARDDKDVTTIPQQPKKSKQSAQKLNKSPKGAVAINKVNKSYENLRRNFNRYTEKVIEYTRERRSVFVTFSSDKKYGLKELQKIGRALQKTLKNRYKVEFAIIVYEPCRDGSWHFHAIICFSKNVPDDLSEWFGGWAVRYNDKPCENQTDVQLLKTKEDVIRVWFYLDPTSPEKRDRIIYYPVKAHTFCPFGELAHQKPTPAKVVDGAVEQEFLAKVEAEELTEFYKSYLVSDEDTGEVLYEVSTYFFRFKKSKLNELITPPEPMYIDGMYEYLIYERGQGGLPPA